MKSVSVFLIECDTGVEVSFAEKFSRLQLVLHQHKEYFGCGFCIVPTVFAALQKDPFFDRLDTVEVFFGSIATTLLSIQAPLIQRW